MIKKIHIIGGGTISHVRTHLALTSPAYGTTARKLEELCKNYSDKYEVVLHLTKMANSGIGNLETNEDVERLVDSLLEDESTKMIFFNVALTDYKGNVLKNELTKSGKYEPRLQSRLESPLIQLEPTPKIIDKIRKERKDIYLIGFKTTSNATENEQYIAGLNLLKSVSCNLVLANDVKTRTNIIITPEEARYNLSTDRDYVLKDLVEMAYLRSSLRFTRSKVLPGQPVRWNSSLIPETLRTIVNYCITKKAYKPFRGSTAGHFAVKLDENTFLTSIRKTNFNELDKLGLVKVITQGNDLVISYGAKPSVGGQSQRIIFHANPDYDCIVHFHCPIKESSLIPRVSQRPYECGSHECGENTARGLKRFGNLSAVYLIDHGPNIVFNHNINPNGVIEFIEDNFELNKKTGGPVQLEHMITA